MEVICRFEKSGVREASLDLEHLISGFLPTGSGLIPAPSGIEN